jgi:serine O-acetyltransferase
MNDVLKSDISRYSSKREMPKFQKYYRKAQSGGGILVVWYKILFLYYKRKNHIELSLKTKIGKGLYVGHPYGITINPNVVIGNNCNIHKGVTIGQENRGRRKGTPTIGDSVWIGINSTIVGNITIGDDVLIAPNSYVNCNVPSHSICFGNPCVIKNRDNATEDYINRKV